MRDGNLSDLLKRHLPSWHWVRIESAGTATGIPDLNGCKAGVEVWIECKRLIGKKVDLSAFQATWLERRARVGGRTFVAARNDAAFYLFAGARASEVRMFGIAAPALVSFAGKMTDERWGEVERCLTRS